jgi:hypothetical protein
MECGGRAPFVHGWSHATCVSFAVDCLVRLLPAYQLGFESLLVSKTFRPLYVVSCPCHSALAPRHTHEAGQHNERAGRHHGR